AGVALVAGVSAYIYRQTTTPSAPVATVASITAPSTPTRPPSPPPSPAQTAAARTPEPPAPKLTEEGAKVAALREILERLPEQSIPELKLATEADWYNAVDGNPLESTDDTRRALGRLRSAAE